ncbi:MAG: hypothetical protein R3D85_08695 [Paracoccaceae bacterium]
MAHLVAPNWIHYAYVQSWQAAFPGHHWAAPGVAERAAKRGMVIAFDHDLGDAARGRLGRRIDQMIVRSSKDHREAVFFHRDEGC